MGRFLAMQSGLSEADYKMLHALGADNRKTYIRHGKEYFKPYRNYFTALENGDKALDTAHEAGYVTRETRKGYRDEISVLYQVTQSGWEHLEKVTGCHIYGECPVVFGMEC